MPSEVPSGWRECSLESATSLIKDGTHGTHVRVSSCEGVPLLSAKNVTADGMVRCDETDSHISEADFHAIHKSYRLKAGDILLTVVGTLGRHALLRSDPSFTIQRSVAVVRPAAIVNGEFLNHFFAGERFQKELQIRSNSTAQAGIYLGELGRIQVLLPPLPEQKKIAAILSSVDEAIRATQAVIDQTRRVKEGLLQELLTRGIGPDGKPHTRFKQTEIGAVPEGWEVRKLDDVAERGSGHTPSKRHPSYWDGGIPWVSLADSHRLDRVYIDETDKQISDNGIANSSAVLHPKGTVLVSRDASVGRSAIAQRPLAVSQHFITWRCGVQLYNLFLYYWLQSQKPVFEGIATGSTIKTIGLPFFKLLRLPLPSRPEQEVIAARLFQQDKVIWTVEAVKAQHQATKSSLLTALLTGQVRVSP